jgi:hypothetical protein
MSFMTTTDKATAVKAPLEVNAIHAPLMGGPVSDQGRAVVSRLSAKGERSVERSEAIGIADPLKPYAGFLETMVWRKGCATVSAGESLEKFVNWTAMKLDCNDGEAAGWAADQL